MNYYNHIYAANNGTITGMRWGDSYGYYITINHNNGYATLYAHMQAFAPNLRVGSTVARGQLIGYMGSTGNSTGPHLHLGLANGRWYTDYYSYYGSSGFVGKSFDPRNVIIFPPKGSSYSNR
jgi:murein DD-endopeptidase MepM/ murein hydrolase activator NlpD